MDIDHAANLLYVACDDRALVEVDAQSGKTLRQWPLAGGPDATFFNPASGVVHVAIAEPGLVQSIDPRNRHGEQARARGRGRDDRAGRTGPAVRALPISRRRS